MDDTKILVGVLTTVGILMILPVAVGGVTLAAKATTEGVCKIVDKISYKRKIKKGLKNGTVIEIDGQYYEIEIVN